MVDDDVRTLSLTVSPCQLYPLVYKYHSRVEVRNGQKHKVHSYPNGKSFFVVEQKER